MNDSLPDGAEQAFIESQLNPEHDVLVASVFQSIDQLIVRMLALATSGRSSSIRLYRTAVGLFLKYLESVHGEEIPPAVAMRWYPFAICKKEGRQTVWEYRPPAAVLRWVEPSTLEGFVAWRSREGDSSNTASTRLSVVKTLLRIAYREDIISSQQAKRLHLTPYKVPGDEPRQQVYQSLGRWLTNTEVRALRNVVDTTTNKGKRDIALIDTLLFLGLRQDELRSLTWGDFQRENDSWELILNRGKVDRQCRLWIPKMLYLSLMTWFTAINFWQEPAPTPLFLNVYANDVTGKRTLTGPAIDMIINDHGVIAGISLPSGAGRLTATTLRRTCGRNAYSHGASLQQVQHLLGHSQIGLTAKFIGAFDDDAGIAIDYIDYYG